MTVVTRRLLSPDLLRPHLLQSLRRTVAVISIPLCNQLLSYLVVFVQTLRLKIGPILTAYLRPLIPVQSQPAQATKNTLHGALNLPGNISILNADNKAAPVVPGKEPGKQGRPDITHMGKTGGTRRKTRSDFSHKIPFSITNITQPSQIAG
ncbi:hypothetical protein ES703_119831 [subsurface metagenome]